MTHILHLVIPGDPVPKGRPRAKIRKRGRKMTVSMATPKETAEYEKRIRLIAQAHRPTGWPTRCKFIVTIGVYRTVERGDWDNYGKLFCDAVNPRRAHGSVPAVPGVLWSDDARVFRGTVELFEVESNPRLEATIEAMEVPCARCKADTYYPDAKGRCDICSAAVSSSSRHGGARTRKGR